MEKPAVTQLVPSIELETIAGNRNMSKSRVCRGCCKTASWSSTIEWQDTDPFDAGYNLHMMTPAELAILAQMAPSAQHYGMPRCTHLNVTDV